MLLKLLWKLRLNTLKNLLSVYLWLSLNSSQHYQIWKLTCHSLCTQKKLLMVWTDWTNKENGWKDQKVKFLHLMLTINALKKLSQNQLTKAELNWQLVNLLMCWMLTVSEFVNQVLQNLKMKLFQSLILSDILL